MVVTPFNIGIPITQTKDTQTISQDFLQYLTALETSISSMEASMGSFVEPGTSEALYTTGSPGWLIDPVENTNGINVTTLFLSDNNDIPTVWATASTSPTDSERLTFENSVNGTMTYQNIFLASGLGLRVSRDKAQVRYNVL